MEKAINQRNPELIRNHLVNFLISVKSSGGQMIIYDAHRNGKEVYVKKNYSNDWDGTFQGSPLGEGTYYYIVDFGTGHPQLKGFVSIVR